MPRRKPLIGVVLLLSLVGLAAFWLQARAQGPTDFSPDAVYHNGKIVTVDKNFSTAQAFAVYDDKFVAVGSNNAMLALAGPRTKFEIFVLANTKTSSPAAKPSTS